ncbi:MAG: hypothetical protein ACUVXB_13770 [Bryobacteraceae bacterium]
MEVEVAWHFYMTLIIVRRKPNQDLFEKCKNDQTGRRLENALRINALGSVAPTGLRNHWGMTIRDGGVACRHAALRPDARTLGR